MVRIGRILIRTVVSMGRIVRFHGATETRWDCLIMFGEKNAREKKRAMVFRLEVVDDLRLNQFHYSIFILSNRQ